VHAAAANVVVVARRRMRQERLGVEEMARAGDVEMAEK